MRSMNVLLAGIAMSIAGVGCMAPVHAPPGVPAWAYPINPPTATAAAAQISVLFTSPDWYPAAHSPMPEIVAHGRPPDVYACGYCHSPSGQGRPENAALAGLPAAYIVQQVMDFKTGARDAAWHAGYRPTQLMIQAATRVSDKDLAAAAEYFSQQHLGARVIVSERVRIARTQVQGWVYVPLPGAGEEPLGERLIEIAPDILRHEKRDDRLQYIAYVPVGSLARGRRIAETGASRHAAACGSCHGGDLKGVGAIPAIAGRSPTYVLRQLLAFQSHSRHAVAGLPMQAVVADLPLSDLIAVAAYAASRPP